LFKVTHTEVFKTHLATLGVVNFYSAGVVTHDRRIGSRILLVLSASTITR
jgi:hypothetical protein